MDNEHTYKDRQRVKREIEGEEETAVDKAVDGY